MVAEKELVVKEYRNRLWAAGLEHTQIDAIVGVMFDETDRTIDRIGEQVDALANKLQPLIAEMIEQEVSSRMSRLEQRVEKMRETLPVPKSIYFDEEPDAKPRRRIGSYVVLGIGACILGPILLSLVAAVLKGIVGLMLHLLS